jgi:succinate dehydrogenase/fumarate reductase flavoprotein subunit
MSRGEEPLMEKRSCNVLVIGGGLAGLQAAEVATQFVDQVVVVDKGEAGKAPASLRDASTLAAYLGQGVAGLTSPLFNRAHITFDKLGEEQFVSMRRRFFAYRDEILAHGDGLGDPTLAEFIVDGIYNRMAWLESYGLQFLRDGERRYIAFPTPGHSEPRTFVMRDAPDEVMEKIRRSASHLAVQFHDRTCVMKLLTRNGSVIGALAVDLERQVTVCFEAKAILLATGGASRLYQDHPDGTCGDGYHLALGAGAELANMEFVYFIPEVDALREAPAELGSILLGSGIEVRDSGGKPVSADHEKPTTAQWARAIFRASESGALVSAAPEEILAPLKESAAFRPYLKKVSGELRWSVGCSGLLGGVAHRIFATPVRGLFVAGEVATGLHGADALPSVGTSFTLYSSENGGSQAAAYAARMTTQPLHEADLRAAEDSVSSVISGRGGWERQSLETIETEIRRVMWEDAGIVRDATGLEAAKRRLEELQKSLETRGAADLAGAAALWEMRNLLTTAQLVCRAALLRKESRGQHFRSDFPGSDDVARRTVVRPSDGQVILSEASLA